MNRNINIGVLGLGRLFEKRLNHLFLKETKRVNLVSVFDLNKKKNSKYSKIFNLQKNHSLSEFLQKKYDYVYIATESGNHYKHTILALKNGHNIILEKPPVLKIEDFNNLIKLEKKFRKKIYVVFQNRLNSSVYLFNKKIDNIDPQNILNVSLNLQWSRDKKYYSDWHGKWKMDGGVLAQQGIHYIDLLCFFFGKPIKTIAYCSNKKHKIECEDTITALIQFKSDIVAQVFLTTAMFNKDYEASITVSTNKKIIKIPACCLDARYAAIISSCEASAILGCVLFGFSEISFPVSHQSVGGQGREGGGSKAERKKKEFFGTCLVTFPLRHPFSSSPSAWIGLDWITARGHRVKNHNE